MKRARYFAVACAALACGSSAVKADSIWSERTACIVADNKAYRAGDVLTIVVVEDSKVSNSTASALSKSSATLGQIDAGNLPSLATGNVASIFKGALIPKVQYTSSRTLDGKGSYDLQGSMQTQLAAIVMEVLPNGNLVIEGSRLNKSAQEKVLIRVSGIVRPADIRSDNTVLSSSVAEGKIVFETDGPVDRSTHRGPVDKLIDFIWPF